MIRFGRTRSINF